MSEQNVYVPSSALDSFGNVLYAERLADIGTREPFLMVGIDVNKNKPQYSTGVVKVHHFIRGEDRNKTFEVKPKMQYVFAALELMKRYSEKPFGGKNDIVSWGIKGPKIVNGKMTSEKIIVGKLVVGRTEKGPFISVVHWNERYPHIAFYPGLFDYQSVENAAAGDPEASYNFVCATAAGWVEQIKGLLTSEWSLCTNRIYDVMRKAQAAGGGGQGGGGNSYGGNSGGNNNNNSYNSSSNGDAVVTEGADAGFKF